MYFIMQWRKKGLIYCVNGSEHEWKNNSFLTPQPYLLDDDTIRVYGSFRDKDGVGRIGYVDVEAENPSNVLKVSSDPVLDIGRAGRFDDNGVILGDVIDVKDRIFMYYVGFQHVQKVKFYAFSGLAVSTDKGESFTRVRETPVLDRSEEGLYGRCIHSVIYDDVRHLFRVWYSVIYDWTWIDGIPYPTYDIKYAESQDGIHFPEEGIQCVKCNAREYRIGRPKVRIMPDGQYEMRYTSDTYSKEYVAGYAVSNDGINWIRKDDQGWLKKSEAGFDSEMACYPAVFDAAGKTYMFYDGNGMGLAGFGYAVLGE